MFCAESFAQVNTAAIRGSVGDPARAVIPGARIKVVNEQTGAALVIVYCPTGTKLRVNSPLWIVCALAK
jgi:hypothetical protein